MSLLRIWIYVAPSGTMVDVHDHPTDVLNRWDSYTVDVDVPGLKESNIPEALEAAGPVVEVKP